MIDILEWIMHSILHAFGIIGIIFLSAALVVRIRQRRAEVKAETLMQRDPNARRMTEREFAEAIAGHEKWAMFHLNNSVHIVPMKDHGDHDLDDAGTCACNPKRSTEETSDGRSVTIYTHNSYDGREAVEWAKQILRGEE